MKKGLKLKNKVESIIDINKIDFIKIRDDIYEKFYLNGIILKSDQFNCEKKDFKNKDEFEKYLKLKMGYKVEPKKIINKIFTNGGCFLYARTLKEFFDSKGINSNVFLLMLKENDINGEFSNIDIDHALVSIDNKFIDIDGDVSKKILSNHLYLNKSLYDNYSFGKNINVNKNNLIHNLKDYSKMDNFEWLYECGDLENSYKEVKEILFEVFEKNIEFIK